MDQLLKTGFYFPEPPLNKFEKKNYPSLSISEIRLKRVKRGARGATLKTGYYFPEPLLYESIKNEKYGSLCFRDTIGRGRKGGEKGRFGTFPILAGVTCLRICQNIPTSPSTIWENNYVSESVSEW